MDIFNYIEKFIKKIPMCYPDTYWNNESPSYKGFFLACCFEKNSDYIGLIIKRYNIDINYCDKSGNNGFSFACWFNENLAVIKYLMFDLKINVYNYGYNGKNGFLLRSQYNNLNFIHNLLKKDETSYVTTLVFCHCLENNKNNDVVEYLINYFQEDIYNCCHIKNEIRFIFKHFENFERIIFLIEKARIKIKKKQIYNIMMMKKFERSGYNIYIDYLWKNCYLSKINLIQDKVNFINKRT